MPEVQQIKTDKHEPPYVCQFKSRAQTDAWLFCMDKKLSVNDWAIAFKKVNFKEPPMDLFSMPRGHQLKSNGDIYIGLLDSINKNIDLKKDKRGCRLCWGYGLAYIIRGPLLFNDTPGKLIATKCWCQR